MTANATILPPARARKVGLLLGVGVFLLPYIFAWVTLRPGYSRLARLISFGWMVVLLLFLFRPSDHAHVGANTTTSPTPVAAGSSETTQPAKGTESPPAPSGPPSAWSYDSSTDQMRGSTTNYARLQSTDQQEFGFPYKGGFATLTLREESRRGLNVYIEIEGQFICNEYSGDHVSVKFDDGGIERFPCAEPAAGGVGTLFIESERRFVEQLKKSKHLTIEANFYQSGRHQMNFDSAGLKWPPAHR